LLPGNGVDAFSFLADPGEVPFLEVSHSSLTPGDLTLSWAHSCSVGAEDYAIYEGVIGNWYSHFRIDCSDDGADFVEEITPSVGNRYYLLVPLNPNDEGSFGTSSALVARPPGPATCMPTHVVSPCP